MAFHIDRELILNATPLHSLSAGRRVLNVRKPLRALAHPVRTVIVPEEVGSVLDGGIVSSAFPSGFADARIAQFIAGYLVYVSLRGTSAEVVDLERLRNEDEVWMFCFRRPKPGWRLFGRFGERDRFCGLRLYDRHELPNSAAFAAALETILDYEALFGAQVLRARRVDDYLSGVWRDVDEPIE
jgi:hypothetical protein